MRSWTAASLVALVCLAAPGAHAAKLTLRYEDGRTGDVLPLERLESDSDELYVSANDLVRALRMERYWKPETRKLVLKIDERKIQVTVDTRLVVDEEQDVLLRVPVRYRAGSVMLPLELLERVLAPAPGSGLQFERATLTLRIGTGPAASSDVTGIDYEVAPEATRVRVHLGRPLRYRAETTSREIVRLVLADAKVDAMALTADRPTPRLRSVRAEQRAKEAALYFELERGSEGFQASAADDGRTIVLTLQRPSEPIPAPEFKLPPATHAAQSAPPASSPRDTIDVLVLDPGHGGSDAGVQSAGKSEKEVALSLAQQLKPLLERDLGMRVVLVRSDDQTLPAERRAEIANRSHGDLFLSLHCNGWYDKRTRGFEALFTVADGGSTRADAATATASAPGGGPADFLPWNTAQAPFLARSQALAEDLQVELGRRLSLPNRGVKQEAIEVLKGVAMPAVVLELGFLTNSEDAAALTSADFAADVAAGVVAAVQRFRRPSADAVPATSGTSP